MKAADVDKPPLIKGLGLVTTGEKKGLPHNLVSVC